MKNDQYSVILDNSAFEKKHIKLSRFDLDENYCIILKYIINYLQDNGYEVDSNTQMEKLKCRGKRQYFEIFFWRIKKTGLFRKKTERVDSHTLWVGYTGDGTMLREVAFKIDGKTYTPNPAFQEIYAITKKGKLSLDK